MRSGLLGAASMVVVLLLATPAIGYHGTSDRCAGYDVLTFAVGSIYYLVTYGAEGPEGAATHSFYLYRESNGVPELQRGGWAVVWPDDVMPFSMLNSFDPCWSGGSPDEIVYGL